MPAATTLFMAITLLDNTLGQPMFSAHDVQNVNRLSVISINDTAWIFNDLTISGAGKFHRRRTAVGVSAELVHMSKYALNQPASGCGLIKSYVVGNGIEIVESRLGPNYFNHRAMRFLALA